MEDSSFRRLPRLPRREGGRKGGGREGGKREEGGRR
jgi:hypothetical protein